VLIVDNEPLARRELRRLLEAIPEVAVAGEVANLREASELVERLRPGVVFLNAEVGDEDGYEFLEKLSDPPKLVFVTAHGKPEVAARGSGAAVIGKPVNPVRLRTALERCLGEGSGSG
jgi:two-component system LytT family response regulator